LRLTAHIDRDPYAEHELKQKQALNPTKVANTTSASQVNYAIYHDNNKFDDSNGVSQSQTSSRSLTVEDEEVETRKTPNFASYQLQRWMLETSSSCITLAERLEKSKWKYPGAETVEDVCKGDCDESWGRKSYDWILFSE
jgi:hypothetical protein